MEESDIKQIYELDQNDGRKDQWYHHPVGISTPGQINILPPPKCIASREEDIILRLFIITPFTFHGKT